MTGPGVRKSRYPSQKAHDRARIGLTSSALHNGIARRVVKELPVRDPKRMIAYELECGHIVKRWHRGKQFCYCAACLMVRG